MAKWRLLIMSLPVVAIVLGLRYLVHDVAGINDVVSFSDAGAVLTGASIIVGLMLGGVIADYKESEKLPAALAGSLAGFEGLAIKGLEVKGLDTSWVHPRIVKTGIAINDWLYGRISDDEMFAAVGDNAQLIVDLEKAGVPSHYLSRLFVANGDLGGALSRMSVIRNTSFIKSGYALMEILIAIVLGLLVIVDYPKPTVQWVVSGVLAAAYTYLVLLVKDLDNPFDYGANGEKGSAADVDLSPWKKVFANLQK
jgi:hypothetical protein